MTTTEPRAPELARRDEVWTGRYHLWAPLAGISNVPCPRASWCEPLPDEYLGEPVTAALVPTTERCGGPAVWPLYVPRQLEGPLPGNWAGEKIPHWYVWWRLFELQEGRCACCPASPNTIDHDHRSGRVRGLLCTSCNRLEADYFRRLRMCVHAPPYCFEDYWRSPPALPLRWVMNGPGVFRHAPKFGR
ncbi:endonuclease domain-containing protein [Actinacidiphila rubida]|uniref:Recombination endonuclease VII n=1 Tax=Actinacidiphila rubida TaxID=310780 RepID=A0A1H8UHK2_9ACTN|nr:endonuclease domain-containing protein [Actinacidiphila rubida]SEP02661.1 Recombination endonuclease VII [Actinacidiphila rubida]